MLAAIGAKSVTEGALPHFGISATDADGTTPELHHLHAARRGATFTNNGNGTGTFNWTPNFTQAGTYNVIVPRHRRRCRRHRDRGHHRERGRQPGAGAGHDRCEDRHGGRAAHLRHLGHRSRRHDPDASPPSTLPTGATFTDNGNGTGTFNWTPTFAQSGSYNVTFRASDGVLRDTEIVTITVNNAGNQAPVLATIGPQGDHGGRQSQLRRLGHRSRRHDADASPRPLCPPAPRSPTTATARARSTGRPRSRRRAATTSRSGPPTARCVDTEIVSDHGERVGQPGAGAGDDRRQVAPRERESELRRVGHRSRRHHAQLVHLDPAHGRHVHRQRQRHGLVQLDAHVHAGRQLQRRVPRLRRRAARHRNRHDHRAGGGQPGAGAGRHRPQDRSRRASNLNFGISATDPDGTTPNFTTSTLPTGATFTNNGNGTGTFNWTPTFTQAGNYPIVFRATDGVAVDTELVTDHGDTKSGNQAPVLATIGPRATTEGALLTFGVSATDADGTTPRLHHEHAAERAPRSRTTATARAPSTGRPTSRRAGSYNVTFRATDGTLVDTEMVTITVNEVGQPGAGAGHHRCRRSVTEGALLSFGAFGHRSRRLHAQLQHVDSAHGRHASPTTATARAASAGRPVSRRRARTTSSSVRWTARCATPRSWRSP